MNRINTPALIAIILITVVWFLAALVPQWFLNLDQTTRLAITGGYIVAMALLVVLGSDYE